MTHQEDRQVWRQAFDSIVVALLASIAFPGWSALIPLALWAVVSSFLEVYGAVQSEQRA